ncbi:MAG: lysophospholipase [Aquiluna sp.]|nr:lysophospholipase [Aquiluna sp.]MCF8545947.1 lysophospholipase [Aquiluna sp.]
MSDHAFETWNLESGIAGFIWRAESAKAQVLLQHGLGEYSKRYVNQYNALIPKLNDLGFDVYAFDLPGHGESDGARGLIDLQQGVDLHLKARAQMGNLPTVLYGHSLGGLVTAGSVVRNFANIAGAVIGSSAMHQPSQAWERVLSSTLGKLLPNAPIPLPRPGLEALSRDQEVVDVAASDPMFFQGKAKNLVAKTVLEISDEVWSKVDSWKVPTLIMHGDKDTSTDHTASIALYESIGSVDKELKLYPGAYHELLNDLVKEDATADLTDWLLARV